MNFHELGNFLLWCAVLNYAVLLVWFVLFRRAHGWLFRLHGRWFRLSEDRFDAIHYGAMAIYKLGILLLNLIPCIALHLMGAAAGPLASN